MHLFVPPVLNAICSCVFSLTLGVAVLCTCFVRSPLFEMHLDSLFVAEEVLHKVTKDITSKILFFYKSLSPYKADENER